MRNSLVLAAVCLFSLVACKRGMESKACVDYFAKNEACAAKAPAIKANILRTTASTTKAGFEKNSNPIAIQKTCEVMLQTLETDPDCK